jgi:Domain of unknown function (DUF1990)
MMVSLRRRFAETMCEFLESQSKLGFTSTAVGATASLPPPGFMVDHVRIRSGHGEEVFTNANYAPGRWEQFRLGWLAAWSPRTQIQTGAVVAVVAHQHRNDWRFDCARSMTNIKTTSDAVQIQGDSSIGPKILPGNVPWITKVEAGNSYKIAWRTSPRLIGWGRPSGSWYSVCGA